MRSREIIARLERIQQVQQEIVHRQIDSERRIIDLISRRLPFPASYPIGTSRPVSAIPYHAQEPPHAQ